MVATGGRGGGSVIVISWTPGAREDREVIAHGTIKHAVLAMTRQMAADCVREGI
jgi:NAD(P)-dependent dehydrogenase (short-subunit alcohol dehydrogenase family)